jgi:hypothetical protein
MAKECDKKLLQSHDSSVLDINGLTSLKTASSASVILDGILTGIDRDESLSKSKDSLRTLSALLQSLLKYKLTDSKFESNLWRLLTRTLQILARIEDSKEHLGQNTSLLGSGLFEIAQQSIEKWKNIQADDAFAVCYEAYVFIASCGVILGSHGLEIPRKPLETATQSILSVHGKQLTSIGNSVLDRHEKHILHRLQGLIIRLPQSLV